MPPEPDRGPDATGRREVPDAPEALVWPGQGPAFVPTLGDRLRDVVADPRTAAVVLLVVAVAAGVFWYRTGSGPTSEAGARDGSAVAGEAPDTTLSDDAPTAGVDSSGTEGSIGDAGSEPGASPTGEIVVHVAGAVGKPGVVRLSAGSRVADAVEAAGGGVADADLDRLNLAAVLEDGQRILVARRGDPPEVGDPTGVTSGAGSSPGGDESDDGAPIDLNTATTEELESLPGIGPVLAEAIIDERESRGGFRSVNELRDVRGIGEKRFEDLKDRVVV